MAWGSARGGMITSQIDTCIKAHYLPFSKLFNLELTCTRASFPLVFGLSKYVNIPDYCEWVRSRFQNNLSLKRSDNFEVLPSYFPLKDNRYWKRE